MIVDLSPADVAALIRQHAACLVDVREPAEFAAAHVAGAVLHPLSAFNPAGLPAGPIVFMCGSGKRSQTAIARCSEASLPHRSHLTGGLKAWTDAGFPTV